MGRLIDADTLSEHKFQEVEFHGGSLNAAYRQGWNDAIDAIVENEPTVDAVPVRRGRWKHKKDLKQFFCDQCGEPSLTEDDVYFYGMEFPNFCPNCGARNIEGDNES